MTSQDVIREWWASEAVQDRKLVTRIAQTLGVRAKVVYEAIGIEPFKVGRPAIDRQDMLHRLRNIEPFAAPHVAALFKIKRQAATTRIKRMAAEGLLERAPRPPYVTAREAALTAQFWVTKKQETQC